MGLLDSNKFFLKGVKPYAIATNASGAQEWNVNTNGYKTLSLLFRTGDTTSGTTITFAKKYISYSSNYIPFNVYIDGSEPKIVSNVNVAIPKANGVLVYIDVSDCDELIIKKAGDEIITLYASLSQFDINESNFTGGIIKDVLRSAFAANNNLEIKAVQKSGAAYNTKELSTAYTQLAANVSAETTLEEIPCSGYKKVTLYVVKTGADSDLTLNIRRKVAGSSYNDSSKVVVRSLYNIANQDSANVVLGYIYSTVDVDCDGCDSIVVKKVGSSGTINKILYSLSSESVEYAEATYRYFQHDGSSALNPNSLIINSENCTTLVCHISVKSGTAKLNILSLYSTLEYLPYYLYDKKTGSFSKGSFRRHTYTSLATGEYIVFINAHGEFNFGVQKQADSANTVFEFYLQNQDISSIIRKFDNGVTIENESLNVNINDPVDVIVAEKTTEHDGTVDILHDFNDYVIKKHTGVLTGEGTGVLDAVWNNIAIFTKVLSTPNVIQISTDGLGGELTEVALNSTNFPNLIEGSKISSCFIVPYTRRTTSGASVVYNGRDWRLVVVTDKCQIYHNFPSRANGYDGTVQSGDMTKFDESVVWDLPGKKNPVKTNAGNDATLINTGVYKYIPCLPDHMYSFYPAINQNNGYGNTGFDAVRTYNDIDGSEKKRARFFIPVRGVAQGNSFVTMNGRQVGQQMTVIGTYLSNTDYNPRICVFTTNDGREWFNQYEYGTQGRIVIETEDGDSQIQSGNCGNTEYDDVNNRISWGTNTMTDPNAFTCRVRLQYAPSEYNKEPEKTHKFKYGTSIAIESITSDATNGIVVTTATDHPFGIDDIVIESAGGNADWDWLCAKDHTAMSAGNGTIWKTKKLTSRTFQLMLEVKNPENNLRVRHIHAVNKCKDGYAISCGEGYPNGWVEYMYMPETDDFSNCFAGNTYPVIRLISTDKSVYRCLGFELTEDKDENGDNICYFGSDHYGITRNNVTMPAGRTDSFMRNSTGVFKIPLSKIDDFNYAECLFPTDNTCFLFRIINDVMVYTGMRECLALSKDHGKTWVSCQLPTELFGARTLLGVTDKNEICIATYGSSDCRLLIQPKV